MAADDKFEREDLPRILAALKTAKDAGVSATVTVTFSDNGGVLSVVQKTEKRFK